MSFFGVKNPVLLILVLFSIQSFSFEKKGDVISISPDLIKIEVDHQDLQSEIKKIISDEYKKYFKNIKENKEIFTEEFSDEILEEVNEINEDTLRPDTLPKKYLQYPFITIDNDYSKDLDQAMAIERYNGGYKLFYAIADASYFLLEQKSQSPMQDRASKRILTTYYPGGDLPLLPRKLSEDLCSLGPNKERRAFIIELDLTKDGQIIHTSFERGVIKSRAQLSYNKVQAFYNSGLNNDLSDHDYTDTLILLRELGEILVDQEKSRFVVKFLEGELRINPTSYNSDIYTIQNYKRLDVELWNEQISLISNYAVGEHLNTKNLQSIHRYLPETEDDILIKLSKQLKRLKRPWDRKKEKLAQYVNRLDISNRIDLICRNLASRSTMKASYDALLFGHDALKLKHYDQFTAPMRRNLDVYNHLILSQYIEKRDISYQNENDTFRSQIAERAKYAMSREKNIEKRINNYFKALVFKNCIGDYMSGYVELITRKGILIKFNDSPFEMYYENSTLKEMFNGSKVKTMKDNTEIKMGSKKLRMGQDIKIKIKDINFKNHSIDSEIII